MARWRALAGLVATGLLVAGLPGGSSAASARAPGALVSARAVAGETLAIYYTPPVLVRSGEPVRIPVDVVCATPDGRACPARVGLGTRQGGAWRLTWTPARPGLRFDVTGPIARAVAGGRNGSFDFYLRAQTGSGAMTSLPDGAPAGWLRVYVTADMPVVHVPSVPFGRTRRGRTVLYLPWGSGASKAGLAPGHESEALGPSSFDLDRRGSVYLADPLQQRLAVFAVGRPVRAIPLMTGIRPDVAVAPDGSVFVADRSGAEVSVLRVDPSGRPDPAVVVGPGLLGQVRTAGSLAAVSVLPADAWLSIGSGGEGAGPPTVGMPLPDRRQLLRVAREDRVRLGIVGPDGSVRDAVELRSALRFGDLALAEPDGHRGYVVVVHVWRMAPSPADQYQVIQVAGARVVRTFAVADGLFAETPPLSRFRLGPDGDLYQLTTSPDGMRIKRYDLKEES